MMGKVLIMERSDAPFAKALRTAETEIDGFGATGFGPAHDKLRARYDNALRGRPDLSPDECFAIAWRDLSLSDRNAIRAEESGEFQEQQAEEARRRRSAMRAGGRKQESKMNLQNVNKGALAMLAFEGAAEALRKREPSLTREQAFARVYTDPANAKYAAIERTAAHEHMAGIGHASEDREALKAETIVKRDHALEELRRLAVEIRKAQPHLSESQAFAKAYRANPSLAARERQASRELLY